MSRIIIIIVKIYSTNQISEENT